MNLLTYLREYQTYHVIHELLMNPCNAIIHVQIYELEE